jgi:hypothetical protein
MAAGGPEPKTKTFFVKLVEPIDKDIISLDKINSADVIPKVFRTYEAAEIQKYFIKDVRPEENMIILEATNLPDKSDIDNEYIISRDVSQMFNNLKFRGESVCKLWGLQKPSKSFLVLPTYRDIVESVFESTLGIEQAGGKKSKKNNRKRNSKKKNSKNKKRSTRRRLSRRHK